MKTGMIRRRSLDLFYRYGRFALSAMLSTAAAVAFFFGRDVKALDWSLAAHRLTYDRYSFRLIRRNKALSAGRYHGLITDGVGVEEAAGRSIIVRWPSFSEDASVLVKGIIIITFTKTFTYYIRDLNVRAMSDYFHIVLEPSWAGYSDPEILIWEHLSSGPVFVQASEIRDRVFLSKISENLFPVSIGASDWVDHQAFRPLNLEKIYDSVYVANTNPVKRVHRYLDAVRCIVKSGVKDYRGALVCAGWGGKEDEIRALVDYYGVRENVFLAFSLKKPELNELINRSKVNVLLSYKEGSNRSLFESMFSGIPVLALSENIGVNKSYINEFTGLLTDDDGLERGLLMMRKHWGRYDPRTWALRNIAPERTMEKLIGCIRTVSGESSEKAMPYYIKVNNPEVSFLEWPDVDFKGINREVLGLFSHKRGGDDLGVSMSLLAERFRLMVTVDAGI